MFRISRGGQEPIIDVATVEEIEPASSREPGGHPDDGSAGLTAGIPIRRPQFGRDRQERRASQ